MHSLGLVEDLLGKSYVAAAEQGLAQREQLVRNLLAQRRLPAAGWPHAAIEHFLLQLAAMDSNNFPGTAPVCAQLITSAANVGVGEREGRVFSELVRRRHYGLAHGIGRSGDLVELQPKAVGSSLLYKLASALALDALHVAGLTTMAAALLLPTATGLSITLVLLSLKAQRPTATRVLWPRIDQKSCLKAILAAGLEPVVLENVQEGDEVRTDLAALQVALAAAPATFLAVVSTTSCFAPRAADR
jgi:O-phospho-L-seryl-tRNASec:L-selenocysteinyl-tRNA synthase